jgi:cell division inhibitor SulA
MNMAFANLSLLPAHDEQRADIERITEFVFPDQLQQHWSLILPLLSHLSHLPDSRWLSCIGLLHAQKKDCQQFGLNWQRLLQVFPNNRCAVFELTERVLQAGKSHTVVSWLPHAPTAGELARLEAAATNGHCQGIIIHSR